MVRALAAVALLAVAVAGGGCGSKKAKSQTLFAEGILPYESAFVRIVDNRYRPPDSVARPQEPFKWFNQGKSKHTATSDPGQPIKFDTGTIDPGKKKKVKLEVSGTVTYHCRFHPEMKGRIEIVK